MSIPSTPTIKNTFKMHPCLDLQNVYVLYKQSKATHYCSSVGNHHNVERQCGAHDRPNGRTDTTSRNCSSLEGNICILSDWTYYLFRSKLKFVSQKTVVTSAEYRNEAKRQRCDQTVNKPDDGIIINQAGGKSQTQNNFMILFLRNLIQRTCTYN